MIRNANRRRNAESVVAGLLLATASPVVFAQSQVREFPTYPGAVDAENWTVRVEATDAGAGRRYDLHSTAPQRENTPDHRTVVERAGDPAVRSGSLVFDALFAQSVTEARANSVSEIRDSAYNGGEPIPCNCFETGEKWHYVWTRDLAYALDLGLAGFDPPRAVDSLLFKTSGFRQELASQPDLPAGSMQIVQDTGSGGSWPVSTDRTTWALGAERTLANLAGNERKSFAAKALAALIGTLEADRVAAHDPRDGLYGGEHSFLDWREQTYAPWIVDDLAWMAQSKALSTNIVQLRAMRLAAELAGEAGDEERASRYARWTAALTAAINRSFWNEQAGMYVTYVTADYNPVQVAKYDLLGNALAILSGVADEQRGKRILSNYPFAPYGPPVVWPQAPDMFVYHNRAQWPFVTAYALRAAADVGHVGAADRSLAALVRGAAINLSNMENLEWLTGRGMFDDGPQINSRRQLWSIAGYYGAVVSTVFGWQVSQSGLTIRPFLTTATRELLGDQDVATATGLDYMGRRVNVRLALPGRAPAGGHYPVAAVLLNGERASGPITADMLNRPLNDIEVQFGPAVASDAAVTDIPMVSATSHDDPGVFMAPTPVIQTLRRSDDGIAVTLSSAAEKTAGYALYRNGEPVMTSAPGAALIDRSPPPHEVTACYTVVAIAAHPSQPSAAECLEGTLAQRIDATSSQISTNGALVPSQDGVAMPTIRLSEATSLEVPELQIDRAGTYGVRLTYNNSVHTSNTGVTNAVKRLKISRNGSAEVDAIVQMPHVLPVETGKPLRHSTPVYANLEPGTYRLSVGDHFNMSSLASNASYSGPGGEEGPINQADVASVEIDLIFVR